MNETIKIILKFKTFVPESKMMNGPTIFFSAEHESFNISYYRFIKTRNRFRQSRCLRYWVPHDRRRKPPVSIGVASDRDVDCIQSKLKISHVISWKIVWQLRLRLQYRLLENSKKLNFDSASNLKPDPSNSWSLKYHIHQLIMNLDAIWSLQNSVHLLKSKWNRSHLIFMRGHHSKRYFKKVKLLQLRC